MRQGWHYHWNLAIAESKFCCTHSGKSSGLPSQSSESSCHTMSAQYCGETQFQKRKRCLYLKRNVYQLQRIIRNVKTEAGKCYTCSFEWGTKQYKVKRKDVNLKLEINCKFLKQALVLLTVLPVYIILVLFFKHSEWLFGYRLSN